MADSYLSFQHMRVESRSAQLRTRVSYGTRIQYSLSTARCEQGNAKTHERIGEQLECARGYTPAHDSSDVVVGEVLKVKAAENKVNTQQQIEKQGSMRGSGMRGVSSPLG